MPTIAEMQIKMGYDLKDVKAKLGVLERTSKKTFKKVSASTKIMSRGMSQFKAAIGGAIAAFTTRAFVRSIKSTIDLADSFQKLNDKLGLTTEFLSEMRFVASRNNIETRAMTTGFQRAIRRMEEFARTGKGVAKGALDLLGGGLAEAVKSGESFESIFPKLADAFQSLDDPAKKVAAAFKLFDTEGVDLVRILQLGSSGIARLREEAKRLGLTISGDTAKRAAEFNDTLTNLTAAWEGFKLSLIDSGTGSAVLGVVGRYFENLSSWLEGGEKELLRTRRILAEIEQIQKAAGRLNDTTMPGRLPLSGWYLSPKSSAVEPRRRPRKPTDDSLAFPDPGLLAPTFSPSGETGPQSFQTMGPPLPPTIVDEVFSKFESGLGVVAKFGEAMHATMAEVQFGFKEAAPAFNEFVLQVEEARAEITRMGPWEEFFASFKIGALDVAYSVKGIFDSFAAALGNTIADIIVDIKNVKDAFIALGKSVLKAIISTIIELAVKALAGAVMAQVGASIIGAAKIAVWAGVTFAAAYAAAIETMGIVGIALGPAIASGAVATMLKGAKAAAASGAVAGGAMAEGGIVTRPTMALIGESGPEAVIPLDHGGGKFPTVLQLMIDGDLLGEAAFEFIPGATRRMGIQIA